MNTEKQTIESLRKGFLVREFSSVELTQEYLKTIDAKEPKLNVFVSQTREQAIEAAAVVDRKIVEGQGTSLIAGIPSVVKDNFNWKGTRTTASSKILTDYVSPYNATVIQHLLDNDAVILGKSNMDAFAHGSSTETSDFGVTRNPYDLARVSGGSSGGSAVAVAANMAVYGIGSETAGSVRGPAAWCGIYGFVPTYGRNSRYGVVAMGSSLDRPGVLANSVMDCAIVNDAISGQDSYDATTIQEPHAEYAKNLSAEHTNLTIGIPRQFLDDRIDKEVAETVITAVKEYERLGIKVVEIDLLDPKYSIAVYTIVMRSEVSSNLGRIDGIRYGHVSDKKAESVLDQIAYNRGEGFGNEAKQRSMTGAYTLSAGYYDAYYKKAQRVRTLIIQDFANAFKKVDLILGPTMPTVAPKIGVTENNPLFGELTDMLTEPSALAGLPCISIPVGIDSSGMPIGMQIIGPQFKEQAVLNLAYLYEQRVTK
ncbi:Asp-tRNA(Asn)/Glu-tRNA(Gln) amidotransferase subunit GatA [bacterium]|nr:Asp-tRNA(Asn)/Glu-tRNA(Gln) amidotransferase subunit GatA [bacterium]